MPSTLRLKPPADYDLARDVCSYGYFLLAPNRWDTRRRVFTRTFAFGPLAGVAGSPPISVEIEQPKGPGSALVTRCSRTLARPERAALERALVRMLRLDVQPEHLAAFHRVDPRWKASGRGRLFRSPTMFEDVLKTVTSCNVTWPSTVHMNARLCHVLGRKDAATGVHGFPSAATVARARPATLRARCRVGYRDARIVELARLFRTKPRLGGIDVGWFEDPATPDDAIHERLLELPGIGPYAAANIMQLLGRYARLPLDTESARHGRVVLGMKGSQAQLMKRVRDHFAPFGEHAFLSYWFEIWAYYESKHGKASTCASAT
jgi:3-methyladenine DNA glycosylase/8-oxoguanine DNA glycosylase